MCRLASTGRAQNLSRSGTRKHVWFLKPLFRKNWFTIVAAALLGVASGACTVGLIAKITDVLKSGSAVDDVALIFTLLIVGRMISTIAARVILSRFAQRAIADLRMSLCRRILATSLRQLETIGIGEVYSALTTDTQSIRMAIRNVPNVLVNVAIMLGCAIYLAWLAWYPFLITAGAIGLGAASYWPVARRALTSLRQSRRATSDLHEKIRSMTDGIKELKLHDRRREEFLATGIGATLEIVRRQLVRAEIHFSIAQSWTQFLFFILIGLLIIWQPGSFASDNGTMIGFVLTVVYLLSPLSSLTSVVATFSPAQIALQKIEALRLELDQPSRDSTAPKMPPSTDWQSLTFHDVTFRYEDDDRDRRFMLGPVNLSVRRGELLFLAGGNGCGKTTLAKILVGLYRPESGHMEMDGVTIDAARSQWYQQHFSTVFSDFHAFRELYGLSEPSTENTISDWLRILELDRDVKVDQGTLSTTELSTGQLKRLALLIALLEDRPIYVFDEWAADQDAQFRDIFYKNILPDLREKGRTIVVISHDERYFHLADRLLRIDDGKVAEIDPHS